MSNIKNNGNSSDGYKAPIDRRKEKKEVRKGSRKGTKKTCQFSHAL